MRFSCRCCALLSWILSFACGPTTEEKDEVTDEPQRYAAAVCTAVSDCGCHPHLDAGVACTAQLEDRFLALVDAGMEFDKDCFDGVITDARVAAGCATTGDLLDMESGADWHCTVLRGHKELGEPCTNRIYDLVPFWANECDEGLICYDGACAREGTTGPVRSLGAECPAGWPASCHNGLLCGSDGTCQEPPGLNEACASPLDCSGPELYCRGWTEGGEGVCTPTVELGGRCDPLDWFACGASEATEHARPWCDPQRGVCVSGSPAICEALDFPDARAKG